MQLHLSLKGCKNEVPHLHGLHPNIGKNEVFWPSGDQFFTDFHPDIQREGLSEGGIKFLGSPVFDTKNI